MSNVSPTDSSARSRNVRLTSTSSAERGRRPSSTTRAIHLVAELRVEPRKGQPRGAPTRRGCGEHPADVHRGDRIDVIDRTERRGRASRVVSVLDAHQQVLGPSGLAKTIPAGVGALGRDHGEHREPSSESRCQRDEEEATHAGTRRAGNPTAPQRPGDHSRSLQRMTGSRTGGDHPTGCGAGTPYRPCTPHEQRSGSSLMTDRCRGRKSRHPGRQVSVP